MKRDRGGWLALAVVAAACGSSPGTQELSEDYAAKFAGNWYGNATYTYRQNGSVVATDTYAVQQLILVTGRNALQLRTRVNDAHPNVEGHAIVAAAFCDWLIEGGYLPPSPPPAVAD